MSPINLPITFLIKPNFPHKIISVCSLIKALSNDVSITVENV